MGKYASKGDVRPLIAGALNAVEGLKPGDDINSFKKEVKDMLTLALNNLKEI